MTSGGSEIHSARSTGNQSSNMSFWCIYDRIMAVVVVGVVGVIVAIEMSIEKHRRYISVAVVDGGGGGGE